LNLPNGDVGIVLTHQDLPPAGCCLNPFFEGDVITTKTSLKIQTDITAFALAYGVTDRLDIGAAIPIVTVQIEALTTATIDRLATGGNPNTVGIHKFPNGEDTATFQQSGNASGVGDVVLRAKYRLVSGDHAGVAVATDVRLPTGDDRDLLGTGTTQIKGFVVGSAHLGAFSPHVNAGYTWSARKNVIPDEINYALGFDWAIHPRFTFIVDGLGRTFRNGQVLREQDTVFQFNTSPSGPPNIQTATLKQLVATQENSTSFSGSVGFKINPIGNLLLTINGLFSLNQRGLQDKFAPLVGVDYSF
jgi:outer membrane putative beta-barrel porin/alpha-amylase